MSRQEIIVVGESGGWPRLRRHLAMLVRLGAPVTLSRIASLMLFVIDTAMIGRASSLELAYFGLANALHMVMMLVGIGMLVGTAVLTAQALGADEPEECGTVWRVAVWHAAGLGLLFAALSLFGESFYLAINQEAGLAAGSGQVLVVLALGLPGHLIYIASTLFLEALGRPRPGLVVMLGANVVNAALNWLLITGNLGLPELGATGAVLATAIVRWGIAVALIVYILRMPDAARFGIGGALRDARATGRKLRRLGYPLGLAQGLESAAFASLTVMAGWLGPAAVAGFQITMNVVAFCFMAAVGIGTATAVRVGHAVGRRDRQDVAMAGWSGLLSIAAIMAVLAVVSALIPEQLLGLFSADPVVLAIAVPTLLVGAVTLVPDGAQGVLMGALRGAGDVWVPTAMHLCSFAVVMIPGAALCAFHFGMGVPGLMLGTLFGVLVATGLLAFRFRTVSGREVRRL